MRIFEEDIHKILVAARKRFQQVTKQGKGYKEIGLGASGDRTTIFDKEVEDEILKNVHHYFGDCRIFSEEVGLIGDLNSPLTILTDPLDGSTNASRGIPVCSTSIAVAEGRYFRDIVAAGVIDLVSGETITAGKSVGCHYNGKPAFASKVKSLDKVVICLDLGVKRGLANNTSKHDPMLAERLVSAIRYPRSLGSAALETAYVAIGRVEGYISPMKKLRPYDCLPSLFLVKEAGGFYSFFNGDEDNLELIRNYGLGYIAAGSSELLKKLMCLVYVEG